MRNEIKASEMTLRDYFAAKVMQSVLGVEFKNYRAIRQSLALMSESGIVEWSYKMADAMLAARDKQ